MVIILNRNLYAFFYGISMGEKPKFQLSLISVVLISLIFITGVFLSVGNDYPLVGFLGLFGDWGFALHMLLRGTTDNLFNEYYFLCYNYKLTVIKTIIGTINFLAILVIFILRNGLTKSMAIIGTFFWILTSILTVLAIYGA